MRVARVLPNAPITRIRDYQDGGGGRGLVSARKLGPDALIEDLAASGLRGRGGAGFPTATKWSSVRDRLVPDISATIVVNAVEGEPGSFKDRMLLRRNPFAVIEGALIAAYAMDATRVVLALRTSFKTELAILERAVSAVRDVGWSDDITVEVFAGPEEYLVGEETGLLEAIAGRPAFPRVSPPYRLGVDEINANAGESAQAQMTTTGETTDAAPTLVNNAETLAHVAMIAAEGPTWFREYGTDESPGTIVCTVSGDTVRAGVGEFAVGTPLRAIIEELGGGVAEGRRIAAVLPGASNPLVRGAELNTEASYEALETIDSGLGCGAFIVYDDTTDFVAVAQGFSRFLAVESCGQCTPCKEDGRAISNLLDHVRDGTAGGIDLLVLDETLVTITNSARCYLAEQHQRVVGSIRTHFADQFHAHVDGALAEVEPVLIAAIVDLDSGVATIDEHQRDKQMDWTFDAVDSGQAPADRYGETSPQQQPPE